MSTDLAEALVWLDDAADRYDEDDQKVSSIIYQAAEGSPLFDQEKAVALSWLKDSCDMDNKFDLEAFRVLSALIESASL